MGNLSNAQVKFLQWLVGILLFALSGTGAWSMLQIYQIQCDLPKNYVMVERYRSDQDSVNRSLERIDNKLDRLIERSK